VRDAIIEPGGLAETFPPWRWAPVRRPALLRQSLLCVPPRLRSFAPETSRAAQRRGALETIAHYLHLLEEAFLVSPYRSTPGGLRAGRRAPPKVIVLSQALLAAVHPDGIPGARPRPRPFGAWIENACLSYAWNAEQRVAYWARSHSKVDGVLDGTWGGGRSKSPPVV